MKKSIIPQIIRAVFLFTGFLLLTTSIGMLIMLYINDSIFKYLDSTIDAGFVLLASIIVILLTNIIFGKK